MTDAGSHARGISYWIEQLHAGDERARDELLNGACRRLVHLTHRMLRAFPGVRRWEDTDDVVQNAAVRLWEALKVVQPQSATHFYRLAALHIRRELIDLARHYQGPEGLGARHASEDHARAGSCSAGPAHDRKDSTYEPSRLAQWAEFHRQVAALADEEAQAFDLIWYQGLTQAEAADLLGVSQRTFRRRWQAARLQVMRALDGPLPT
jgi:RNA polymerase sigma-70 factor (ECF subfamily)